MSETTMIYIICLSCLSVIMLTIIISTVLIQKRKDKKENEENSYRQNIHYETPYHEKYIDQEDDEFDYELYRKQTNQHKNVINTKYKQREYFLSPIEKIVFKNIQIAIENTKLVVFPQINLATIVQRADNYKYQNELFRNLDFCLFAKDTYKPVCAIELNDRTHLQTERFERDIKVLSILQSAGIPLVTLYTAQDNTPEYIRNILKTRLSK